MDLFNFVLWCFLDIAICNGKFYNEKMYMYLPVYFHFGEVFIHVGSIDVDMFAVNSTCFFLFGNVDLLYFIANCISSQTTLYDEQQLELIGDFFDNRNKNLTGKIKHAVP